MLRYQIAEVSEVGEGVQSGVVPIAPLEAQGVVADLGQITELRVVPLPKLDRADVALAASAGAVTPQHWGAERLLRAVRPGEFHPAGAYGGFDADEALARFDHGRSIPRELS